MTKNINNVICSYPHILPHFGFCKLIHNHIWLGNDVVKLRSLIEDDNVINFLSGDTKAFIIILVAELSVSWYLHIMYYWKCILVHYIYDGTTLEYDLESSPSLCFLLFLRLFWWWPLQWRWQLSLVIAQKAMYHVIIFQCDLKFLTSTTLLRKEASRIIPTKRK